MNTVIVVGEVCCRRQLNLPLASELSDETLVVGIEANHELLEQFVRGSPLQKIEGFPGMNGASEFLLSVPSFMHIRANLKQINGTPGSKNSELVYPAYADLAGGVGLLLQVAAPKCPRQAWCYSSYHRHADESAVGPCETFWSLALANWKWSRQIIGSSQVYVQGCNAWKKLNDEPLMVTPGRYHQIRATGWSINLLVLTNIREGSVLQLSHDHGTVPCDMSQATQY